MPWRLVLPLLIFGVLGVTLTVALLHSRTPINKFATHINEPVPPTHLSLMGDASGFFDPADWMGRPYIVNFFASWCVACRAEHDQLLDLGIHYHIPLIGIALQDRPLALGTYLGKMGNPFLAIADDRSGRSSLDWGLTGVPETFVIDATGIIRFHAVGPLTEDTLHYDLLPLWRSLQP